MRILHVIGDLSPETGGPVTAIHGLVEQQQKLGHQVTVVSTNFGLAGNETLPKSGYVLSDCIFGPWRYAPRMRSALVQEMIKCDVVHIHTLWEYPTLLALQLARKMGKPFLLRPCGMLDKWSMSQSRLKKRLYLSLFGKTLFSKPCLLHFTTMAEQQKSLAPFAPRSIVIENGLSEAAMATASSDAFLELYPDLRGKSIVLFLSRVHPKKRPDIAILAFARVAASFPDSLLVVAGPCPDDYREGLIGLAETTGFSDRVRFTGTLRGTVLYGAYRAATLFVLPSMQENFGIAVAEAMAAGCPVVISEHVDLKTYVLTGNAGIVCAAAPEPFALAIAELLRDPIKALAMGCNGVVVARQFFTWQRAAKRLDQIYADMTR
jgi:glycosyltransferase involved in cell wall biosynthesis